MDINGLKRDIEIFNSVNNFYQFQLQSKRPSWKTLPPRLMRKWPKRSRRRKTGQGRKGCLRSISTRWLPRELKRRSKSALNTENHQKKIWIWREIYLINSTFQKKFNLWTNLTKVKCTWYVFWHIHFPVCTTE